MRLDINITPYILNYFDDVLKISGANSIDLITYNKVLYVFVSYRDFFKVFSLGDFDKDLGIKLNIADFKLLLSEGILSLDVNENEEIVHVTKIRDGVKKLETAFHYSRTFSQDVLEDIITGLESDSIQTYDMTNSIKLRELLAITDSGVIISKATAIYLTTGLIVFKKMKSTMELTASKSGLSNLIKFFNTHKLIDITLTRGLNVFKSGNYIFAMKRSRNTELFGYEDYMLMVPQAVYKLNLNDVRTILKSIKPKETAELITLSLTDNTVTFDTKLSARPFKLMFESSLVQSVEKYKNENLYLSSDIICKIFKMSLNWSDITLEVYPSFIAFVEDDLFVLVSRGSK